MPGPSFDCHLRQSRDNSAASPPELHTDTIHLLKSLLGVHRGGREVCDGLGRDAENGDSGPTASPHALLDGTACPAHLFCERARVRMRTPPPHTHLIHKHTPHTHTNTEPTELGRGKWEEARQVKSNPGGSCFHKNLFFKIQKPEPGQSRPLGLWSGPKTRKYALDLPAKSFNPFADLPPT